MRCNHLLNTLCFKISCSMVMTGTNSFGPKVHVELRFYLLYIVTPEGSHHTGSLPYLISAQVPNCHGKREV